MGAQVVVPGTDPREVVGTDCPRAGPRVSLTNHILDRPEEPFDAPVLPGRERFAPLMADIEQPQDGAEEQGAHGRFVVGAKHLRRTEALEEIEEVTEEGDGPPALDGTQLEAGS